MRNAENPQLLRGAPEKASAFVCFVTKMMLRLYSPPSLYLRDRKPTNINATPSLNARISSKALGYGNVYFLVV
jgi:hypothetical protein